MLESMNGATVATGMKVWAEYVADCPGNVMRAEVIQTDLEPGLISFHFGEVCRSQCVLIRQLPTPAMPVPAGCDPWVTCWPAAKLLAV